jgi:periplasmic protein TonB
MLLTPTSRDGEDAALPVVLPAELVGGAPGAGSADRRREEWLGSAAAALLHVAILLWLILDWHFKIPPAPPEAMAVRLVMVPPAPEPVPQPPAPQKYRESGKDQQTTAPPAADQAAPEPTAPAPATPDTDAPKPDRAEKKQGKEAPRAPRKEAAIAHAPQPQPHRPIEIEPGEHDLRGDPYLNLLRDLISRHWIVPRAASKFGLPLEGVAVYTMIIDPRGNLISVTLKRSSGVAVLDEAGERMLREAAPFPPPPADFAGTDLPLGWTIMLYSEP